MTNHTDLRPVAQPDQGPPRAPSTRSTGETRWTVRRAGVIAGVALLLMVASAVLAHFVVVLGMVTPGDSAATAAEIVAREGTFRLGVLAWLVIAVLDVVIAGALYIVFRPVDTAVSMLAAAFRLVYTAVLIVAAAHLLRAFEFLSGDAYLDALTAEQANAHALVEMNAFQHVYDAGLLLFGIHLALLGYLSLKSGFVPKVIGAFLVIAGAGYAFDTVGAVLALDLPFRVSVLTSLGELLLGLWLLLAGRRLRAIDATQVAEVRHAF